jgi:hypothetical protein
MNNTIIKTMLLQNKRRVYTLIVEMYFDQIEKYKPNVFKIWLANELKISEELINIGSLNQAKQRYKKKGLAIA